MDTEKLYYADPLAREFSAVVLDCQAAKGGYLAVLDRTAFFPEGGGQPCDLGTLGGGAVTDVQERDGVVFHKVDASVEIGETVTGRIDWARRFDHTQQHSGEHIFSGLLCAAFHCSNVGFHMGADVVTVDYDADVTWEQALALERQTNDRIAADEPVEIAFPAPEALSAMDYRSKKALTGPVRIVTFPGADCCACCGTHVERAGQIGLVKVLSCQKFRQGVRIELVCGGRALALYDEVYQQNRTVGQLLSVKMDATADAVERLLAELSAEKARSAALEESLFAAQAERYAQRGDALLVEGPMRPDAVRRLADAVGKTCGGLAAVFAGEDGSFHYALIRADGGDLSPLVKELNAALHGRGGGRGGFAQGSAGATAAEIRAFFAGRAAT